MSQTSMHALEKEMATHSSMLAWRIPEMEEPGWLPSMGSHRVGHDWSNLATAAAASENHRSSPLFRHTNDSPLKSHGALIYWGWYDSPGLSHSEDILTYTHTHMCTNSLTHTHPPLQDSDTYPHVELLCNAHRGSPLCWNSWKVC